MVSEVGNELRNEDKLLYYIFQSQILEPGNCRGYAMLLVYSLPYLVMAGSSVTGTSGCETAREQLSHLRSSFGHHANAQLWYDRSNCMSEMSTIGLSLS